MRHKVGKTATFYVEEFNDVVVIKKFEKIYTQEELEKYGVWTVYSNGTHFYMEDSETIKIRTEVGNMMLYAGYVIHRPLWEAILKILEYAGERLHNIFKEQGNIRKIKI